MIKMIKTKKFFLFLILVIILPFFGFYAIADDNNNSQQVIVEWNVLGCFSDLEVEPSDVDLGSGVPGNILNGFTTAKVKSNCPWQMNQKLLGFIIPNGHPNLDGVRQRFFTNTIKVTPQHFIDNLQPSLVNFSSINSSIGVCQAKQALSSENQPAKCEIGYQYNINAEDVPGQYQAKILVTLSTP